MYAYDKIETISNKVIPIYINLYASVKVIGLHLANLLPSSQIDNNMKRNILGKSLDRIITKFLPTHC